MCVEVRNGVYRDVTKQGHSEPSVPLYKGESQSPLKKSAEIPTQWYNAMGETVLPRVFFLNKLFRGIFQPHLGARDSIGHRHKTQGNMGASYSRRFLFPRTGLRVEKRRGDSPNEL